MYANLMHISEDLIRSCIWHVHLCKNQLIDKRSWEIKNKFALNLRKHPTLVQFHQHSMCSFCANSLAQNLSTKKLRTQLTYVKAARRTLVKLTPGHRVIIIFIKIYFNHSIFFPDKTTTQNQGQRLKWKVVSPIRLINNATSF